MGGDRGAGDREKRGREVYGRREKRGREAGFPRWREVGEKGKNYATLCNISQSKKCKGAGAKKYRAGTGIKGYGKRKVQTPLSPPTTVCPSGLCIELPVFLGAKARLLQGLHHLYLEVLVYQDRISYFPERDGLSECRQLKTLESTLS